MTNRLCYSRGKGVAKPQAWERQAHAGAVRGVSGDFKVQPVLLYRSETPPRRNRSEVWYEGQIIKCGLPGHFSRVHTRSARPGVTSSQEENLPVLRPGMWADKGCFHWSVPAPNSAPPTQSSGRQVIADFTKLQQSAGPAVL